MKYLIICFATLVALSSKSMAGEYRDEAWRLYELSGLSQAIVYSSADVIKNSRPLMASAIKNDMAEQGNITSKAKINTLLDKWESEYLKQIKENAFKVYLEAFREHLSLKEVRELNEIYSSSVISKFVNLTIKPHPALVEKIQTKMAEVSNQVMNGVLAETPEWWQGDNHNNGVEKDIALPTFKEKWDETLVFIGGRSDSQWGLFDSFSADFVLQYLPKCNAPDELLKIQGIAPSIFSSLNNSRQKHIANAKGAQVNLKNFMGVEVTMPEDALLELAYISELDSTYMFMSTKWVDDNDVPDCDAVVGMAGFLISKENRIQSIGDD